MAIFSLKRCLYEVFKNLLPSSCVTCGLDANDFLCVTCVESLRSSLRLAMSSSIASYAYFSAYSDDIRDILSSIKFEGNEFLAERVGEILVSLPCLDHRFFQSIDYWMAVPLHPKKFKKRGFNQVNKIFNLLFEQKSIPHLDIVYRSKDTHPLFGMSRDQRLSEIEKSFCLNQNYNLDEFNQKTILICDDIYTTGTTINEIKAILEPCSFKEIKMLSLAYVMDNGIEKY